MTLGELDNLVTIKQLKVEPPDQAEFDGMVNSAKSCLQDARLKGLSEGGRFSLAYSAAHALALAAMRWHGYRPDKRYLVFLCLQHTVGLENEKWRVLDKCHKQLQGTPPQEFNRRPPTPHQGQKNPYPAYGVAAAHHPLK